MRFSTTMFRIFFSSINGYLRTVPFSSNLFLHDMSCFLLYVSQLRERYTLQYIWLVDCDHSNSEAIAVSWSLTEAQKKHVYRMLSCDWVSGEAKVRELITSRRLSGRFGKRAPPWGRLPTYLTVMVSTTSIKSNPDETDPTVVENMESWSGHQLIQWR